MDTARDTTLAGRIVAALSRRIIAGDLGPGVPLRQDHVAEEFGSSHVPVREAFRLLEADGLVKASPRRGVRVAPLEPEFVRETALMRASLEALAVEQALPRLTKGDLALARKANAICRSSTDISVWVEANRQFHLALMQPCAMPRLLSAIAELHRFSERYLYATWKHLDWQPRSDKEHARILRLLQAGDGTGAINLLKTHIVAAGTALAARLGT